MTQVKYARNLIGEREMIERLFLRHPHALGESYLEHQAVALSFAGGLLGAALTCAVHAIVPALFTKTASRTVEDLHERLVLQRAKPACEFSNTQVNIA